MTTQQPSALPDLKHFDASTEIGVSLDKIRSHIAELKSIKTSSGTTVRFLYLVQDKKKGPSIRRFLHMLDNHLVRYTLQNAPQYTYGKAEFDIDRFQDALRKARTKFKHGDKTGQLGELIIFCLTEAILGAPQAVAKMHFKLENEFELSGMDGIHAKWDAANGVLTLIWAEAKIEKSVSAAVKHAFESLVKWRTDGNDAEDWDLLTGTPSQLYPGLDAALAKYRDQGPSSGFSVADGYAVFIGFQESAYEKIFQANPDDVAEAFLKHYEAAAAALHDHVCEHDCKVPKPWASIDVCFLPFPDVDDLRKKFEDVLRGEPVSESP